MAGLTGRFEQLELRCIGLPDLVPGRQVKVKGLSGRAAGKFLYHRYPPQFRLGRLHHNSGGEEEQLVSSIADLLNSNGEFGRDPALSSSGGFVQGVVTDNGDKKVFRDGQGGIYRMEKRKKHLSVDSSAAWLRRKRVRLLHGPRGRGYRACRFIGPGMERPFVLGGFSPPGRR